ncbi:MAG: DUF2807 domain-containing protein [Saprospiraceae bacterium]|nr:DUF2807 domain-containing protein [Saprospiraceae bacterium]
MKNIIIAIGMFTLLALQQSCVLDHVFDCEHGRGEIIEESFRIDDVHSIDLRMDAIVFLTQGDDREVVISGQANIIDEIDFRVRNRELVIDNHRCIRNFDEIQIFITVPDIRELSIAGSGKISSQNQLNVNDLQLSISGSGDMDLDIVGDDVSGRISGSGSMKLSGLIDDLNFTVSGSGTLRAFDLESQTANVTISGSGDVEITVIEALDVRISGSGNVYFRGDPIIDSRISGSGRVVDDN